MGATLPRSIAIVFTLVLAGCGGGGSATDPATGAGPSGGDTTAGAADPANPGTTTTPGVSAPVSTTDESPFVRDNPQVYAVETAGAIGGRIITYDGTFTFADVNADTDDTDAVVPEVNAHLVLDSYADDGQRTNATLRLRGHTSRLAQQKSYRVKLAGSAAAWRGEKTLQFNKHPYDLTRIRQKLSFDLFRDIPHIPSLRTQFVRLTIENRSAAGATYADATDYGLFTHVEKMGTEYLAARGLPTDGNIYKAENFAFRMAPALALDAAGKPADKAAFETVLSLEADNGNHQKLLAMLAAVNDPASEFATVFERWFDRSNYITWLATSLLMGDRDTVDQNFALYQPKGTDRFYFLPWDYDGAFNIEEQPSQAAEGPLYSPVRLTLSNWWSVPLHRRFISDPRNVAALRQAVDDILAGWLTEPKLRARIDAYSPIVQPFIAVPPDATFLPVLAFPTLVNEWATEAARLATVAARNRERFLAALDTPMPYWQDVQAASGELRVAWDAAFDLQGDAVTYTAQIAPDPAFATIALQMPATDRTNWTTALPATGTWYLRVTARDAKGNTQMAFDEIVVDGRKYFGVLGFRVTAGGVSRIN